MIIASSFCVLKKIVTNSRVTISSMSLHHSSYRQTFTSLFCVCTPSFLSSFVPTWTYTHVWFFLWCNSIIPSIMSSYRYLYHPTFLLCTILRHSIHFLFRVRLHSVVTSSISITLFIFQPIYCYFLHLSTQRSTLTVKKILLFYWWHLYRAD